MARVAARVAARGGRVAPCHADHAHPRAIRDISSVDKNTPPISHLARSVCAQQGRNIIRPIIRGVSAMVEIGDAPLLLETNQDKPLLLAHG